MTTADPAKTTKDEPAKKRNHPILKESIIMFCIVFFIKLLIGGFCFGVRTTVKDMLSGKTANVCATNLYANGMFFGQVLAGTFIAVIIIEIIRRTINAMSKKNSSSNHINNSPQEKNTGHYDQKTVKNNNVHEKVVEDENNYYEDNFF